MIATIFIFNGCYIFIHNDNNMFVWYYIFEISFNLKRILNENEKKYLCRFSDPHLAHFIYWKKFIFIKNSYKFEIYISFCPPQYTQWKTWLWFEIMHTTLPIFPSVISITLIRKDCKHLLKKSAFELCCYIPLHEKRTSLF